ERDPVTPGPPEAVILLDLAGCATSHTNATPPTSVRGLSAPASLFRHRRTAWRLLNTRSRYAKDGKSTTAPAASAHASHRSVDGAVALFVSVRSATTRYGCWATPQPIRMQVTCPIAIARAHGKRRDQSASSAATAKTLVTPSSSGAHQLVSRSKIRGAPFRASANVNAATGASRSPDARARRRKSS